MRKALWENRFARDWKFFDNSVLIRVASETQAVANEPEAQARVLAIASVSDCTSL
jgi:hypothetical protein